MAQIPNTIPGIFNISHIFPPYREYHWFSDINQQELDLQNHEFSDTKAWFFSEISALLYDDENFNRKILKQKLAIEDSDIHWFYAKGNEAILISYQQVQIVAFQGTHFPRLSFTNFASITRTAENILVDDLVIEQIEQAVGNGDTTAKVKLHKGFVNALGLENSKQDLISLWQQITAQLDSSKPVYLTGHSLGGAMATIMAMRMPQKVAGLYTFGAPCVGDKSAQIWQQQQLKEKFFRYVNGSDIICHIMTEDKFRRHFDYYAHAGELKTLNIQGCLGPVILIENLTDRLGLSFIDHSPIYYALGCSDKKPNTVRGA